jgi:hypothetical protein
VIFDSSPQCGADSLKYSLTAYLSITLPIVHTTVACPRASKAP